MGLLSSFKQLFNKNIECGDEVERHLVYMYPSNGVVRVNANIVVRKNFAAVFVVGDKVADVLASGKHKINGSTIPTIYEKLKLGKPNKKGNLKKKFKADIYFVNLNAFDNFGFISNEPFIAKSEKFGKIKGYCEGSCTVSITSTEDIMSFLLREVPYVKKEYAKKQLSLLVGNYTNKLLEKSKLNFSDILLHPEKFNTLLNEQLDGKLSDFGLSVTNASINSLRLNKKIQKKVNEFLSNSANFVGAEGVSLSGFDNPDETKVQETIIPEKIVVNLKSEKVEAVNNDGEKPVSFDAYQTPSAPQPNPSVVDNPLFNRRLSSESVIANDSNNNYKKPQLDSSEVLNSKNGLKQCKYCGNNIDDHYKFCPKCGYKQAY